MLKDDKTMERETKLDTIDPMLQGLVSQRSNTFVSAEDNQEEEEEKVATFPIEFTYTESLRLNEDTRRINHSLDHIFKGTATTDAVGQIVDDREEVTKL